MAIIPWKPFGDMDKWFNEEEWPEVMAKRFGMTRTPKMDIYEDGGNVVAEVEMPGLAPENINVQVEKDFLKIEAKGHEEKEEKDKEYYHKEISSGFFRRIIPLPVEVAGEKAKANYEEGILKVIIPKLEPQKKDKKIVKVKVSKKEQKSKKIPKN